MLKPFTIAMLSFAAGLVAAPIGAGAQQDSMPQDCTVQPAPDGQMPEGTDPGTTQSLTDRMDACGAVLEPPRVGDGEMVAPPPAVGRTPIIRPEDVPDQNAQPDAPK